LTVISFTEKKLETDYQIQVVSCWRIRSKYLLLNKKKVPCIVLHHISRKNECIGLQFFKKWLFEHSRN
jgi:hypothetical protein